MSRAFTRDDVAKVASLARLELSEAELDGYASQLGRILDYVEILDTLDTENVEPMAHAVALANVFRPDEPGTSLSREEALANAPSSDGRYFLVPPILGEV
ncbi:MAG: Asp-tRNA(Asn)/Glu-tRNA(Gln) amidotransferase subunit GatC [Planctomycetaceae bacterium]